MLDIIYYRRMGTVFRCFHRDRGLSAFIMSIPFSRGANARETLVSTVKVTGISIPGTDFCQLVHKGDGRHGWGLHRWS